MRIAMALEVPLAELVAAPTVSDPRVRLPHDIELGPGEVAEFPTEQPHWFGSTGRGPVELLTLFGTQGEMMHVRAHTQPADRRSDSRLQD
ncbi:hypothetical protein [Leucobacter sp. 1207-22]|uniref:hypothetical protein n=1 Tax=Leucobacter sp. 1207-22 TaxID=2604456 RepID=UPI0040643874